MPTRQTERLHNYRHSVAGARYFITCCTGGRLAGLTQPAIRETILNEVQQSDHQEDTTTLAFVLMPDHLHWLFSLGARLAIGRVVARLKAETHATLGKADFSWQRDFFEHRLRSEESAEDYARYLFLNPYRARLLPPASTWPGWWCPTPRLLQFTDRLDASGGPPAEWLAEPVPAGLVQAD
jgi:REP element-mobilizing transposase RayT